MGVTLIYQFFKTFRLKLWARFPAFLFLSVESIQVLLVLIGDKFVGGGVDCLSSEWVILDIEGLALDGLWGTNQQLQILVYPVEVLIEVKSHPVLNLAALQAHLFAAAAPDQHIFKFKQFISIKIVNILMRS